MIGIDSNVLVRYIAQDDPDQAAVATAFMDSLTSESAGYVSLIVIAELYWVLSHSLKAPRTSIAEAIESLIFSSALLMEEAELVIDAVKAYRQGGADFDDWLIAKCSAKAGCRQVVTFDPKAARTIGFRLLG